MHRDFYAIIRDVRFVVRVIAAPVGGDMALQVMYKTENDTWPRAIVTTPRYLKGAERDRVFAGLRNDDRMPAWALADVLYELRIPDRMCEVVRQAELQHLASFVFESGVWWRVI